MGRAVSTADAAESTTTAKTESTDTAGNTASTDSDTGASDDVGDFDAEAETAAETGADDLGDFDTGGTSDDGASESTDDPDVDSPEDLDDVLDDETREAVKSEHGVGFSTGNEVDDPYALADALSRQPGVLDHGLFLGMTHLVLVGQDDGTVRER